MSNIGLGVDRPRRLGARTRKGFLVALHQLTRRWHRLLGEQELRAIEGRREELEQLERDRDAVLTYYTVLVPEALDSLGPDERHRLYGMLKLKVLWFEHGEA